MSDIQTKAEIQVRRIGSSFEKAGYKVEYVVTEFPAEYFSDGDLMLTAKTVVHAHVSKDDLFTDRYSFAFCTYHPATGKRASTRFVSCDYTRAFRPKRGKRSVRMSLKELRSHVSVELYLATTPREA